MSAPAHSASFNTTLVQLKGGVYGSGGKVGVGFQYHTGPIKSPCVIPGGFEPTRFNTTLVQLKGGSVHSSSTSSSSFNTTLVQLKVQTLVS